MKKNLDIVALGELLIDFTPKAGSDSVFVRNPGGAPVNMLTQFSKFGGRAAFIGKVGKDVFGKYLGSVLRDNGIMTEGLIESEECNTSLAFVELDPSGEREFVFYRNKCADSELTTGEVSTELISCARIFHFGSVSMSCGCAREATIKAVEAAKKAGCVISMDLNYRAHIWNGENEAVTVIKKVLPYVDILKLSEEELRLVTGEDALKAGMEKLPELCSAKIVFVTCGKNGAYALCGGKTAYHPAYKMQTVDTTGAGDAFYGAALYLLKDYEIEELGALSAASMGEILKISSAAGGLTTQSYGGILAIPSRKAIEEFIETQNT